MFDKTVTETSDPALWWIAISERDGKNNHAGGVHLAAKPLQMWLPSNLKRSSGWVR
jgi:hypothetical protein